MLFALRRCLSVLYRKHLCQDANLMNLHDTLVFMRGVVNLYTKGVQENT